MNTTNLQTLKTARPSNVIAVNNVSNQFSDKQLHPATYPEGLVDFFIKSFSSEGDLVYDPFSGSGTTAISALKNGRSFIASELMPEYVKLSENRVKDLLPTYPELE
jgi:site-specific DNA-methyltransferase (adenine-specific)